MSSKIVDISICACDVSMFFKYLQTCHGQRRKKSATEAS